MPALLPTQIISTSIGEIRLSDSGANLPCIVFVPDGPNVLEHYERLIELLSPNFRVICFDMPGFGFSLPRGSYTHSLNDGARAVLAVLDHLQIETATLAFSCANGLYALRAAHMAPARITSLVLSQTPSLAAMQAWTKIIPRPLFVPVLGQICAWFFRRKFARIWYPRALANVKDHIVFQQKTESAFAHGSCFCLAGVVQGLCREQIDSLNAVSIPCLMIWGSKDRSHKKTDPSSIRLSAPLSEIVIFEDCGHFPELEQPERFAALITQHMANFAQSKS